jgi:hypothetical protein
MAGVAFRVPCQERVGRRGVVHILSRASISCVSPIDLNTQRTLNESNTSIAQYAMKNSDYHLVSIRCLGGIIEISNLCTR